jgi:hypothetical protein
MHAYRGCFHPKASVYFIDCSGNLHNYPLDEFISGQQRAHLLNPKPMFEKPTQSSVEVRGRIAHAIVHWELHKGTATTTG